MAESFFDRVHKQDTHTPDVLSCLANLSNDEVFTPPEIVNQMLDMLPQELFASTETTFLDPACKTGIFLREIAKRLLSFQLPFYQDKMQVINDKRANGFALTVDDEIFLEKLQKAIDHIFHKQLFGIAITELTSLLSRRSLYCSKYPNGPYSITHFDDAEGNIRYRRLKHTWDKSGKCVYCGTSAKGELGEDKRGEQLETHAYEWIHTLKPEEIFNMKFDVIISNPPYQLNVGVEKENYAIPIYQKFVSQAKKLNPRYMSMIIPARWYAGGRGLDEFRKEMLNDDRIRVIHDFPDASDCFPGVQIKAGVCYFLWDRDNKGDCSITTHLNDGVYGPIERPLLEEDSDTFIRYNQAISIVKKVYDKNLKSFSELVSPQTPFGMVTSYKGNPEREKKTDLKMYISGNDAKYKGGVSFAPLSMVTKGKDLIDCHKIFIGKAGSGSDSFPHQILSKPFYGEPKSVCNQTYLVIGPFKDKTECENAMSYISTKFFRFMVLQKKNSQDAMRSVYQYVPMQDFSKPWTDEELYKKYNLTQEEIDFIESMIRPMDLDGGEIDG